MEVKTEGVRTATQRGEPSGEMYGGTVHVGCKRNPLIPVGPVPVYIMSEALSQQTTAPLNTSLRLAVKRSRLNCLNLKHLASVSKYLTNEISALITL